jgi:solute carrier family 8 (sodium/calcium exchanger)
VYGRKQQEILSSLPDTVELLGDARCDSMGHCAKYGTFSLMETEKQLIVASELIQSTEVSSSRAMELERLKRCLEQVQGYTNNISLVTDHHPQINKWLREKRPDITHRFDDWHVVKGLDKKLKALGNKKGYELVNTWRRSITHQLYWIAATSNGNAELLLAK